MQTIERLFGMSDAVWRRHTNPLSGWSRISILPLLTLAIWSRVWLGWWCLVPLMLVIIWTWWNPRAFPEPRSTDHWMSKGVLGERVWLNRKNIAIPAHHDWAIFWLSLLPLVGFGPYIWGLVTLAPGITISGMILIIIAKLWFLDRMVWLFNDVGFEHAQYSEWIRPAIESMPDS